MTASTWNGRNLFLLFVVSLLFAAPSRGAEIAWAKSYSAAMAQARKTGKPVMIDFYADWCGWCKRLDSDVYANSTVVETAKQFVSVKLNTETDGQEVARKYQVSSLPTILFINAAGEVEGRIVGYSPAPQFNTQMQEIARQHRELPVLKAKFKSSPQDLPTAVKLTMMLARRGDEAGAQKGLARIAKLDAKDAQGKYARSLNAVGDMYATRMQYDDAIPLFQRAVKVGKKPEDVGYAQLSIAICHIYQRDLDAATTALKTAINNRTINERDRSDARKLLARVEELRRQEG